MFWLFDKQLREIRGTPHYAIGELPEVTVGRIVGVASPLDGKTVRAPFSGRECLAYFARAIQQDGNDARAAQLELAAENDGCRFRVEDGSGYAIVDPSGARCALDIDDKQAIYGSDADERQRAWLAKYKVDMHGGRIRLFEGIVELGEMVSVVGFGSRVDGHLVMTSSPHFSLAICDNHATTKQS